MKMSRRLPIAILFALVLVGVAACARGVHRVEGSNYGWGARENLTVQELKQPIESTAMSLGWELSNVVLGRFTGRREWGGGKHNIVVDVSYNPKNFSILYVDSKAMSYTGTSIHHTYNDMVGELEARIQEVVAKL